MISLNPKLVLTFLLWFVNQTNAQTESPSSGPSLANVATTPAPSMAESTPAPSTPAPSTPAPSTSAPSLFPSDVPSDMPSGAPSTGQNNSSAPSFVPSVASSQGAADAQTPAPSEAPTRKPTPSPTVSSKPTISAAPTIRQQCSAYPACAGLMDDCCPTMNDVFLYCCFEAENPNQYRKEWPLVQGGSDEDKAEYFASTSVYAEYQSAPDGENPVVSYTRNSTEIYDLIYYQIDIITDANVFVTGEKKFYIDIYSEAPACTQIIVQLDSLPSANESNFPIGRHSRYLAATTKQNEWERLEFDFLDRPDENLADDAINAFALFFSPGTDTEDSFYFRNLDIAAAGCTSECEEPVTKSCSALFPGEEGFCGDDTDNDGDGLIDCQDPECTGDAACASLVQSAYASASNQAEGSGCAGRLPSAQFVFSGLAILLSIVSLMS